MEGQGRHHRSSTSSGERQTHKERTRDLLKKLTKGPANPQDHVDIDGEPREKKKRESEKKSPKKSEHSGKPPTVEETNKQVIILTGYMEKQLEKIKSEASPSQAGRLAPPIAVQAPPFTSKDGSDNSKDGDFVANYNAQWRLLIDKQHILDHIFGNCQEDSESDDPVFRRLFLDMANTSFFELEFQDFDSLKAQMECQNHLKYLIASLSMASVKERSAKPFRGTAHLEKIRAAVVEHYDRAHPQATFQDTVTTIDVAAKVKKLEAMKKDILQYFLETKFTTPDIRVVM